MDWFKRNPFPAVLVFLTVALLAGEAWLLQKAQQDEKRARVALEQKKQERDWLARQSPAPSEENRLKIEADLAGAREVEAALRSALQGKERDWLAKPVPAKSIDAYFDLAAFVEKMRTQAARAQVMIKADEHFAFATHANEGPEADLLPAVFRQRLVLQRLLDELLAARPRALLAVQREHPVTTAQRTARQNPPVATPGAVAAPPPVSLARKGDVAADFFEPDNQLSLRQPGVIGTEAFRLEFTGQTPALRAFLNSLATFKVPLIVRSVTVESLNTEAVTTAVAEADSPAGNAPVPLVAQNLSKFTVVVEYVELLSPLTTKVP